MATKITAVLEDDLEGGPADETVRFGIGGTDYERGSVSALPVRRPTPTHGREKRVGRFWIWRS